jgi:aspartate/methionine/tyrosine aminotransferase
LLCDSGGEILVPQPSYPLFDFLAQIHDVKLVPYRLAYDHEWSIDLDSVRGSITPATRALVIVNPHNPAGLFLHEPAYVALKEVAAKHSLALIVDEVFIDYPLNPNTATVSTAGQQDVLTFTLNGLSKMAGLPQMKLGWIVAGGPADPADEASRRLEILCDTFLSVNTPVQIALPELLIAAEVVRPKILGRVRENYAYLRESVSGGSAVSVLNSEGGWSGIIRVPGMKTDEEWALDLLEKKGVYLHPGYFYDFETEGHLVVSFLTPPEVFQAGVRSLVEFAGSDPGDHP